MKYKEKAQVQRIRPYTYEETDKFLRGAWRHWDRFRNDRGELSLLGRRMAANDADFLARRRRVHSQEFVE